MAKFERVPYYTKDIRLYKLHAQSTFCKSIYKISMIFLAFLFICRQSAPENGFRTALENRFLFALATRIELIIIIIM